MKGLLIIVLLLTSVASRAQQQHTPNILDARRHGAQLIKAPPKGIVYVDISEEDPNLVRVYLCDYRGSVPLACREDYNVTMTTSTGRKVAITDYKVVSFGTILPQEFPLTIDVKVKALRGEERYPYEFSMKLLYQGFSYKILLYEEWTGVKGIK